MENLKVFKITLNNGEVLYTFDKTTLTGNFIILDINGKVECAKVEVVDELKK